QPVQMLAAATTLLVGAHGMSYAAPGLHPVDVTRLDGRERAEAVAVHDLAVEQIAHRGEPDVRMRTHVEAVAGAELGRPEMIEEDERPDHASPRRGQRAPHREPAEVDRARHDHQLDCVAAERVAEDGILRGEEAHDGLLADGAASCSRV